MLACHLGDEVLLIRFLDGEIVMNGEIIWAVNYDLDTPANSSNCLRICYQHGPQPEDKVMIHCFKMVGREVIGRIVNGCRCHFDGVGRVPMDFANVILKTDHVSQGLVDLGMKSVDRNSLVSGPGSRGVV